eukprot:GHVT01045151.1.p1 GENE.GHVT01045151.1~~GHVT01045151.1.p1  ORF type:complete len:176 (-),score=41.94 GHVT01045151.1:1484-2011(-)
MHQDYGHASHSSESTRCPEPSRTRASETFIMATHAHASSPRGSGGAADLSWLPSDSEEQLALGFRIVSNAYRTRVAAQEGEIRSLKAQNAEKSEQVQSLQKKNSGLEVQLIEATQRGNQLADENKQLIATIKKLHKDINRLESLKKAVLNSIQEDHGGSDESHKVSAAQHLRCND